MENSLSNKVGNGNKSTVEKLSEKAKDTASHAADEVSTAAQNVKEHADNYVEQIEGYVKDAPVKSVLVAAAIGAVLGVIIAK